jgi:hypothetical protein
MALAQRPEYARRTPTSAQQAWQHSRSCGREPEGQQSLLGSCEPSEALALCAALGRSAGATVLVTKLFYRLPRSRTVGTGSSHRCDDVSGIPAASATLQC